MRLYAIVRPAALSGLLIGCHPPLALQYRQALRPASSQECVSSAVAASPVVANVSPIELYSAWFAHRPGLIIALRDTAAHAGTLAVSVTHNALPDSALQIAVTYEFVGYAPPTAAQRARWFRIAEQIVADVRATCAPNAPAATIECRRLGPFGKKQSCEST
jgi:hypothetical protein